MKEAAPLKAKGKGKGTQQQQSEDDSEMSDDGVIIQETPIPHGYSRYHSIETPGEGNVALCIWFPSNQSQQFNLAPQFPHLLQ